MLIGYTSAFRLLQTQGDILWLSESRYTFCYQNETDILYDRDLDVHNRRYGMGDRKNKSTFENVH
jgi:hypothetical protein